MYGSVYGDIIGSYYENHCTKNYNFEFQRESTFTDDSVMTAAVCRACTIHPEPVTKRELKERAREYAVQYKQYYSWFPHAGYGQMFSEWASDNRNFRKVKSYGNGAAMRVVPIGYAYSDIDQVLLQTRASCMYTHNNNIAIRGAQAVASAVYFAVQGENKEYIRKFIREKFGYRLDRTVSEIRPVYSFYSDAENSVPPALTAFLDSEDYESAVRNAVSLGGDADTMACIAGGIAEAYYSEIPEHIRKFCDSRIDFTIRKAVNEFRDVFIIRKNAIKRSL